MTSGIAAVKEIVAPIAARYGVEKMVLFGSRARGNHRADSDYDFLISSGKLKSALTFNAFWTDLEDALHSPVDIVSDASFDDALISQAQKDGVLVYGSER
ncbi:MAG: nucleotidyltransferase domain-containing protein [Pyramidobacter sp.]|nr:nucleotidyltransferase domain-containing protein [Pyramidobacter sp.]